MFKEFYLPRGRYFTDKYKQKVEELFDFQVKGITRLTDVMAKRLKLCGNLINYLRR